jgi:Tfp pilus assembly protein PilX
MASSPFIAGLLGGASIRSVFLVDLVLMTLLGVAVQRTMKDAARTMDRS